MASPFPGMDPFLENPSLWPDVHHELISVAREILSATLRPKYYVSVEERVYISDDEDPGRSVLIPDLRIEQRPTGPRGVVPPVEAGGVEVAEPVLATTLLEEEIREPYLKVVKREQRLAVALIEVLSPSNKVAGSRGRESYRAKRREVMDSSSHLVEIDLLRKGERFPVRGVLPPHEYLVHVSRASERPQGQIWPIRLSQKLPVVSVPLLVEDGHALLDLQAVLQTGYDRAGYDLRADYRSEPNPPLDREWVEWADRLLRDKGLR